jgi:LPPG:FO 2-phospho-L-lactate transferase
MAALGAPDWFRLGDQDLATHLVRTGLLRTGATLSAATRAICAGLGVHAQLVPMSDDRIRTRVRTPAGWLDFQEFFVRERAKPEVREVVYDGAGAARPAPGVTEAIGAAEGVVICCSNPVTSIGPILAVPGIVEALRGTAAPVVAVSPIVGGAPVSGPAGALMASRGLAVSPLGVAAAYAPWLDALVIDRRDSSLAADLERSRVRPVVTDALMPDAAGERALARAVLTAFRALAD